MWSFLSFSFFFKRENERMWENERQCLQNHPWQKFCACDTSKHPLVSQSQTKQPLPAGCTGLSRGSAADAEQWHTASATMHHCLPHPTLPPSPRGVLGSQPAQICLFSIGTRVCWEDPQLNPGWGSNYSWRIPRVEGLFFLSFSLKLFMFQLYGMFC